MIRQFTIPLLLTALLVFQGCGDTTAPVERRTPSSSAAAQEISVNDADEISALYGVEVPPEYRVASVIESAFIDLYFRGRVLYASASMRHFSSNGRVQLRVIVKRNGERVDSAVAVAEKEWLLPIWQATSTHLEITLSSDCGHHADAQASYTVWMSFPAPPTGGRFVWNKMTSEAPKSAFQPDCPPGAPGAPGGGSGGGPGGTDFPDSDEWYWTMAEGGWSDTTDSENPYEGDCQECQLWLAFRDDELVAVWWECESVSDTYCSATRNVHY